MVINSIKTKVLSLVVVACLFTIGLFFIYSFYVRNEYRELKLSQITEKIKSEVRYVNGSIYGVEQTVKNIAVSAGHTYRNRHIVPFDTVSSNMSFYLLNEQHIPDEIVASGVWFEPYAFYENEKDFAVVVYRENVNQKANIILFDSQNPYNYRQKTWYRQLLPDDQERYVDVDKKKVFWTTPGELYLGEQRTQIAVISSYIYNDKNSVIGIATIGWPVADMVRTLSRLSLSENSKVLLADINNNKVITSNDIPGVEDGD